MTQSNYDQMTVPELTQAFQLQQNVKASAAYQDADANKQIEMIRLAAAKHFGPLQELCELPALPAPKKVK